MAKPKRFYWDSCAWLGVLNGELDKRVDLEMLFRAIAYPYASGAINILSVAA